MGPSFLQLQHSDPSLQRIIYAVDVIPVIQLTALKQ